MIRSAGGQRPSSIRPPLLGLLLIAGCVGVGTVVGGPDPLGIRSSGNWPNYGGRADQSKFVELTQVDRSNVGELQVAWFYPTEDDNTYTFNPLVIDGVMYVLAKNSSLVALDAVSGDELWIHANLQGLPRRGLNYWESPDRSDRRILIQLNNYLQAIDAQTGQSILSFGEGGLVDLKEGLGPRPPETVSRAQSSTPGVVFENLLILGVATGEGYMAAPGHIRAYDVVSGDLVWVFHTIPQPGEFGYETWPSEAYRYVGGANVWAEFSLDEDRGIVYAPTGSPNYDFYGADRVGANLFANTLLALDARTGERIWHFQTVQHDLRDYDLVAAPQLITVQHEGQEVDAVAIATKQGLMFAFDRITGDPLWPIEYLPIPQSHVPGEVSWPTAPFVTALPPYARQSMTSDDLSPYLTDEEREYWTGWIDDAVANDQMGLYTPLSDRSQTLAIPGAGGATNFGHTASDPDRGIVYLISNDRPGPYDTLDARYFEPDEDGQPQGGGGPGAAVALGRELYAQTCETCHGAGLIGGGGAPSLVGIETRMGARGFLQLLASGRGEMPAFAHLDEDAMEAIYRYLGGSPDGEVVSLPNGPVVASGGAPGGLLPRAVSGGGGRGGFGLPYPPEATQAPNVRYFIRSYAEEFAHIISPPWSSILAYDLNTGRIKWRRPLGTDKLAAEQGGMETGVQETIRNGLLVTATGLVFSNAKDGKVYAFDAETGEELWAGPIPGGIGTQGIPTMYEAGGRQFLVVSASTPLVWMRRTPEGGDPPRGYVAFALPEAGAAGN